MLFEYQTSVSENLPQRYGGILPLWCYCKHYMMKPMKFEKRKPVYRGFDAKKIEEGLKSPKMRSQSLDVIQRVELRMALVEIVTKLYRLTPSNWLEDLGATKGKPIEDFNEVFCSGMDIGFNQLSTIEQDFYNDMICTELGHEVSCEIQLRHARGEFRT